jgi:long-chain fatty acid transport protein
LTGFAGFSTDLIHPDMVVAVGLYTPYGLKLEWPESGPQRYSVTSAELRTIYITPSVSYRINDRLSVGAGLSIILADAELKNKTNPSFKDTSITFNPANDIAITVDGDDNALGVDIGVRYRVRDDLALGFLYIPEVKLEFDGNFTAVIPQTMAKLTDKGRLKLELPHQLMTGIYWQGTEKLGLEFDFTWSNWSSHETLTFVYEGTTDFTREDTEILRDWSNSIAVHLGVDYRINPKLTVRGGYLFDQTPVPDKTLDPILPQADKNVFTMGIGYRLNAVSLDLSYAYLRNKDRTISNSVLEYPTNGLYESSVHLISFSTGYSF